MEDLCKRQKTKEGARTERPHFFDLLLMLLAPTSASFLSTKNLYRYRILLYRISHHTTQQNVHFNVDVVSSAQRLAVDRSVL
jgi:hypothetical protein